MSVSISSWVKALDGWILCRVGAEARDGGGGVMEMALECFARRDVDRRPRVMAKRNSLVYSWRKEGISLISIAFVIM